MKDSFTVSPIGYVRARQEGFFLEIAKEYIPGLKELSTFSHVNVLWWPHLSDSTENRFILEVEQPYKNSPPKMGIFATRSQMRPNPIGLSVAPILTVDHQRGIIQVPYIDTEDGTPIIDLKPYHPSIERIREVSVPAWCSHWPKYYEESGSFDWAAEFVNAC